MINKNLTVKLLNSLRFTLVKATTSMDKQVTDKSPTAFNPHTMEEQRTW